MYTQHIHQIVITLLSLICSLPLWGQHAPLSGKIIDANDGTPLAGAVILIPELQAQGVAGWDGQFELPDIVFGDHSIQVRMTGYAEYESVTHHSADAPEVLLIRLTPSPFSLKEIQVTAVPDAGSNIISRVDIEVRPLQTSQDILRMVPGLMLVQHAGGGKAEQIFLRGFDIDHGTDIAITTDGIPVNMVSHAHGQGYADLHYLIPETMEQVHFGKGPYHTHQGNLATAGYVGFQSRNSLEESMISFQPGQYGTYRGVGLFNLLNSSGTDNTRQAYLAGEYSITDGYFKSPQDFRRINVFGKWNSTLGKNHLLTFSGSLFSSRWNASGQIPERAVASGRIDFFGAIDDTEGGNTSRANANLQLFTALSRHAGWKNQFYYSRYGFELYSNFTFFLEDPVNGDQIRQKEKRDLFGWNSMYTREDRWLNTTFKTEAGLQLRKDMSYDNELSRTANRTTILERLAYGDIRESNLGFFLHETVTIADKLTVNAGARLDHFVFNYRDQLTNLPRQRQNDAVVSPKLNAYYVLRPGLQLYAHAGYGFHSNDTRVVVARQSQQTLPKAFGIDAGFIWKMTESVLLTAALWRLDLDQEFVYVGDAAIVEPSGRSRRQGIEVSLRWQLLDWLYADADFNLTKAMARDEPTEANYIPLAPLFSSIGGITVDNGKKWRASLRYRHLGDRPANEANSLTAFGYTLFDALVRYKVNSFELGCNIDNLLNTRWREAQFETESRLQDETSSVSEIHFTPGTPFLFRAFVGYTF